MPGSKRAIKNRREILRAGSTNVYCGSVLSADAFCGEGDVVPVAVLIVRLVVVDLLANEESLEVDVVGIEASSVTLPHRLAYPP